MDTSASDVCDCHVHLDSLVPVTQSERLEVTDTTFPALEALHHRIGIGRAVLVQRLKLGTDTRIIEAALGRNQVSLRGITMIDESVTDAELRRLHVLGFRGIRASFVGALHGSGSIGDLERDAKRIAPLGWHVKVLTQGDQLLDYAATLKRIEAPIVIDHMALLDAGLGIEQAAFQVLLELLQSKNCWVMLSGSSRMSRGSAPWSDTVPFIRELAAAAPDRAIWSSDWPHGQHAEPLPRIDDLLAVLVAAVPNAVLRQKILAENPARLYDFAPYTRSA